MICRLRERLSASERRAFVRQIRSLIQGTGKLERAKVEAAVRLLADAKAELQDRILHLPRGSFSRQTAMMLKHQIERRMDEFAGAAADLLAGAAGDFAEHGQEFARALIKTQGYDPPPLTISPDLVANTATRSADLITSLSQAQIGVANTIINRGILTGKSTYEVARALADEFDKGLGRMEAIARTEMLMVYSQATQAQYTDMGQLTPGLKKQWVAVQDARTRLGHEDAHLQSVPVDGTFDVALTITKKGEQALGEVEQLQFPRDPAASPGNLVNCRCTFICDFSDVHGEAPFSAQELPPVQAPLEGLAAKVSDQLKQADL